VEVRFRGTDEFEGSGDKGMTQASVKPEEKHPAAKANFPTPRRKYQEAKHLQRDNDRFDFLRGLEK